MMAPTQGGDQPYLKHLNRAHVLHLLRTHPGLSRAELAAHSGLTKVTVGSLVTGLLDAGWLDEGGARPGATGRPGRELHLGETRHVLLGAEIGVLGARAVATTLRGTVLARAETRTPTTTPHAAAQTITRLCGQLLQDPATQGRELLGLGVALPGPVSPDGTRVLYAPNLGWDDVPFLELLRAAPDIPPTCPRRPSRWTTRPTPPRSARASCAPASRRSCWRTSAWAAASGPDSRP
ncbi:ROK family transcriptional regulator [Deinococcus actinosclerus]|uniref:ROK family transcriptional regulator n=1 Tax=Deinococcus actinosclerus TaxID=1768108 RepID=UPI000A9D291A|nr:ROK family protein [Deinococcus actinosclerus]